MNDKNKMIYKYPISVECAQIISMPKDAKILTMKIQNDKPCIWVEFDVENKDKFEDRYFVLIMTGQEFGCMKYIDTFFRDEFVLHLYERTLSE